MCYSSFCMLHLSFFVTIDKKKTPKAWLMHVIIHLKMFFLVFFLFNEYLVLYYYCSLFHTCVLVWTISLKKKKKLFIDLLLHLCLCYFYLFIFLIIILKNFFLSTNKGKWNTIFFVFMYILQVVLFLLVSSPSQLVVCHNQLTTAKSHVLRQHMQLVHFFAHARPFAAQSRIYLFYIEVFHQRISSKDKIWKF